MSEFGLLECMIRDPVGIDKSLLGDEMSHGTLFRNSGNGNNDVLSASMQYSGIWTSNELNDNNDVS